MALRDPAGALRVIDGPWRSECVAFLGESVAFSQRVDGTRTIVRDTPNGDYFYVASRGHSALGPCNGKMDTYVDGRGVPQGVIDTVIVPAGHSSRTPVRATSRGRSAWRSRSL